MKGKGIKNSSLLRTIVSGILVSAVVVAILLILLNGFLLKEKIGEDKIDIACTLILCISAFVGGIVPRTTDENNRIITTIGVCVSLMCILLCTGMLLFDGGFTGVVRSVIAVGVACAMSCYFGLRRGKKGRRNRRTC